MKVLPMFNKRQKYRLLLLFAFIILGYAASHYSPNGEKPRPTDPLPPTVEELFQQQKSDVLVTVSGSVSRILEDDNAGSRHQRFIITLDSGQTLLIAHNIDLAPRIDNLQIGDEVSAFGEYEWNDKGGVLHWTHHDPQNRHPHGWIKHQGQLYQ